MQEEMMDEVIESYHKNGGFELIIHSLEYMTEYMRRYQSILSKEDAYLIRTRAMELTKMVASPRPALSCSVSGSADKRSRHYQ